MDFIESAYYKPAEELSFQSQDTEPHLFSINFYLNTTNFQFGFALWFRKNQRPFCKNFNSEISKSVYNSLISHKTRRHRNLKIWYLF